MTNIKFVKIDSVKQNPSNPRIIDEGRLSKLVKSIKEFPQMLEKRPLIVNQDGIILGGNMRHRAASEAGLEKVPVIVTDDWTPDQEREFIMKDNIGFGDWDWDLIKTDWDEDMLSDWGVKVPQINTDDLDLDGLFDEPEAPDESNSTKTIILEYTNEDYEKVTIALDAMSGSREEVIFNLLGL